MELLLGSIKPKSSALRNSRTKLLKDKNTRWENAREEATSRISELSRYFAGSETLSKFSGEEGREFDAIGSRTSTANRTSWSTRSLRKRFAFLALLEVDNFSFHQHQPSSENVYCRGSTVFRSHVENSVSVGEKSC